MKSWSFADMCVVILLSIWASCLMKSVFENFTAKIVLHFTVRICLFFYMYLSPLFLKDSDVSTRPASAFTKDLALLKMFNKINQQKFFYHLQMGMMIVLLIYINGLNSVKLVYLNKSVIYFIINALNKKQCYSSIVVGS